MPETQTITTYTGVDVEVEHVKPLSSGGGRFDLTAEDGRKWRVDVTKSGKVKEVVTTWRDGTLADLDEPEWIGDILSRLTAA